MSQLSFSRLEARHPPAARAAVMRRARRIAASGENAVTITAADIPGQLADRFRPGPSWRAGQYL